MGVLVFVVGPARAVPENYKSLILNDALINWFDPRGTYRDVVTRAADEAGGQGFVTELAGAGARAADAVFTDAEASVLERLERDVYDHPIDAVWAASWQYRTWEGFRDAVAAAVTLPAGVSLDAFASDPDAYRETATVDVEALFQALRAKVIDPVLAAQRVLRAGPYLTRLFTTLSSDEMTLDPVFTWNADLPDLSHVHVAHQYIECHLGVTEYEAPWRIELPLGDVVRGAGTEWPVHASMVPANRIIEQLSNAGQGSVLMDNTRVIADALEELPSGSSAGGRQDATRVRSDDGGCAVVVPHGAGRAGAAVGALAVALAVAALRRRRRHTR